VVYDEFEGKRFEIIKRLNRTSVTDTHMRIDSRLVSDVFSALGIFIL